FPQLSGGNDAAHHRPARLAAAGGGSLGRGRAQRGRAGDARLRQGRAAPDGDGGGRVSVAAVTAHGAILDNRRGWLGGLSDYFWRRPQLLIFLLLTPAILWLGIVYLGSLLAMLVQSFWRL